jgi:hypothetical protein
MVVCVTDWVLTADGQRVAKLMGIALASQRESLHGQVQHPSAQVLTASAT